MIYFLYKITGPFYGAVAGVSAGSSLSGLTEVQELNPHQFRNQAIKRARELSIPEHINDCFASAWVGI
jgi:hypothetical protein